MASELEKADSHTLAELKKHVKANSKGHILACLTRVKAEPQCCKRFVKAGGVELLVQLMRYQDLKIMNTALSILANLCMNSDTRQQVSLALNLTAYIYLSLRPRLVFEGLLPLLSYICSLFDYVIWSTVA